MNSPISAKAAISENLAAISSRLAPGELWVKTAAELQQGGDPSVYLYFTHRGSQSSGDYLQESTLTATVSADNPHGFTLRNVERQIAQGPELSPVVPSKAPE